MSREARRARARMGRKVAMGLLAIVMAVGLLPATAQTAHAYFNFGTVGVSLGSSSVSVLKGASAEVSVSVTPSSDDQTRGCGMAKCPQVCSSEGAIEAGYNCFDTNGQCTCAGAEYSTYYPSLSASSSNSGIATASISGSTLVITGKSEGVATITVNASLRQWTSASATIQVTVKGNSTTVEGAGSGGSSSSESGASGSSGANAGASTGPSGSSGGDASGASSASGASGASGGSAGTSTSSTSSSSTTDDASTAGTTSVEAPLIDSIPEEAVYTESRDDAPNEQVIETVAGTVYVAECNAYLDATAMLAKAKGTSDQVVLWSGVSSTQPDYSWTFYGEDIPDNIEELSFDPTIAISKMGTGYVANLMAQAQDGIVMDFTHEGELPCKASLYVNVDAAFNDGQKVSLYCYDDEARVFDPVLGDIEVIGGYATFLIDHCSTWAFSTDALDSYAQNEVNTPGAARGTSLSVSETPSWVVPLSAGIIVVAAVALAALLMVNRRRATAGAPGTGGASPAAEAAGAGDHESTEEVGR